MWCKLCGYRELISVSDVGQKQGHVSHPTPLVLKNSECLKHGVFEQGHQTPELVNLACGLQLRHLELTPSERVIGLV